MDQHSKEFFKTLLSEPGISGFEERARRVWRNEVSRYADACQTDVNGSEIATLNGKSQSKSILLMGHIDQIGLIVRYVDDNGFIFFSTVGTFDLPTIVDQRVTIMGPKGDIPGVLGRTAIHLQPRDERNKSAVKLEELFIDIGARTKAEAEAVAPIGTPIQVGGQYVELMNGRFASRIDNRFGAWVVAEVLRRAAERKADLVPTLHVAATVQEETSIGFTGAAAVAYRLNPTAAIAVDVNQAVDTPGVAKHIHGDARLGGGPILNVGVMASNKLAASLQSAAKKAGIPLQLEYNNSRTWTDADALPGLRTGIPAVYLGTPTRYMHNSVELGEFADMEQVVELLLTFLFEEVTTETDFTP